MPEIGREFSNRDHTTIIHSVKTIEKIKEKDPEMVDNINKLKNQILYNNKENDDLRLDLDESTTQQNGQQER